MHILLIDDDEVDRKLVKRALDSSNLDIKLQEAANAQEAKTLFDKASFDCLLLDYRLPDIDGLAFAKELLGNGSGQTIPIVMLTGEGNEAVAVEAMKLGVQDYLPKGNIDSGSLERAINNAVEKTCLRNKIDKMNRGFERMALNDSLTGLGNRNLFTDRMNSQIAVSRRSNEPFSLLMMDLNKFKEVNDTHGHEAGDAVLREVGKRFISLGRDADSFYRLGGDEFAALVTTGVTREGLAIMAGRIINAFETPVDFRSTSLEIGISIGIVIFPEHSEDGDQLLGLADAAMYEAKRGRLGFSISSATINQAAQ